MCIVCVLNPCKGLFICGAGGRRGGGRERMSMNMQAHMVRGGQRIILRRWFSPNPLFLREGLVSSAAML